MVLGHQVLVDVVHLLQVAQDVVDLLVDHLEALLPIGHYLSQPPDIHPVGSVGAWTPLNMAFMIICREKGFGGGDMLAPCLPHCNWSRRKEELDIVAVERKWKQTLSRWLPWQRVA